MSKFKSWTRERIRENQRDIKEYSRSIRDVKAKLASLDWLGPMFVELEDRVKALEEKIKSIPNGELPTNVYDLSTLKAFIDIRFYEEARRYWDYNLKEICMQVRDTLAETYADIERINDQAERHDYTAPEEKHADAFMVVVDVDDPSKDYNVDFCMNSSGPGRLIDRLTWSIGTNPPWRR